MGKLKYSLLMALAAAMPAVAAAQDNGNAPALQDFRLDPARDPNRPRAPERAGPEIGNVPDAMPLPTVNAPAVNAPPVATTTRSPAVAPTVTSARRAAPVRPLAEPEAPSADPAPLPATTPEPEPSAIENTLEAPTSIAPASEVEVETGSSSSLPWIVGGILVLLIGAFLFWRRRKNVAEADIEPEAEYTPAPAPEPVPVAPVIPAPSPSPAIVTRAQEPPPTAAPLTLSFTPVQARTTIMGAQLGYSLTLRNESREAMDGIAIAAFMVNADAQQSQMLAAFFADPFAPEAHRVAHLGPGEDIALTGELRLDRLVPIEVQGRALLIPLVAFKVISLDGDELARATFIVGQESTPPREKMAPFRLDQGPRQFRDIGSRPAQEAIPA